MTGGAESGTSMIHTPRCPPIFWLPTIRFALSNCLILTVEMPSRAAASLLSIIIFLYPLRYAFPCYSIPLELADWLIPAGDFDPGEAPY